MLILLSLVACGLFAPKEPEVDPAVCSAESTKLAEDLASTAAILSYRIPEVEKVGQNIDAPLIGAPLRTSSAATPVVVLAAGNTVRVGPKASLSLDDAELVPTLKGLLTQASAPTPPPVPADLSPLPLEAWTSWSKARSKPVPTLAIDGAASGSAASRLLAALYEAGAHEVELVVSLTKPPQIEAGTAPPASAEAPTDPAARVWGECDHGFAAAVQAAPPAMRPWLFADKAPAAYAACACKPEVEQIKWQLASQFEVPTHATVHLTLSPQGKKVEATSAFVGTARELVQASSGGGAVWLEISDKPAVPRFEKRPPGKFQQRTPAGLRPATGKRR